MSEITCPNCQHQFKSKIHNNLKQNLTEAYELYQSGKTPAEIGKVYGVTDVRVRNVFKEAGLTLRTPSQAQSLRHKKSESGSTSQGGGSTEAAGET